MKKLTALFVTCCVSGCAAVPEKPLPPPVLTKIVTQRIEVPFRVACLNAADVPVLPAPTIIDIDKANQRQVTAALAADDLALEQYALKADPLLRQCATLPPEIKK